MKKIEFLPDALKPKLNGLTSEELKIYDDFNSQS